MTLLLNEAYSICKNYAIVVLGSAMLGTLKVDGVNMLTT